MLRRPKSSGSRRRLQNRQILHALRPESQVTPMVALSRRALALCVVAVFLVDAIVALVDFDLGSLSRKDRHASAYETVTSDTLACCIVRLLVFPSITLCALVVYRRTEAQSPLRKFQQAQEVESPPTGSPCANGNDMRVPLAEAKAMKADVRKEAIMIFLFAISTGMSFYNGIKCIVYHYDPRFLVLQGSLQALTMVIINVESRRGGNRPELI
eukprot:Skav222284  [mRNA]  locus=scaffold807:247273:263414:- [translate_table: standard]